MLTREENYRWFCTQNGLAIDETQKDETMPIKITIKRAKEIIDDVRRVYNFSGTDSNPDRINSEDVGSCNGLLYWYNIGVNGNIVGKFYRHNEWR